MGVIDLSLVVAFALGVFIGSLKKKKNPIRVRVPRLEMKPPRASKPLKNKVRVNDDSKAWAKEQGRATE